MPRDDVLILDAGDAAAAARHLRDKQPAELEQYSASSLRRAAELLRMATYLADQAARKLLGVANRLDTQDPTR